MRAEIPLLYFDCLLALPFGILTVLRSRLAPSPLANGSRPDSPLYNPTRNRASNNGTPNAAQDDGYDPKAKGKAMVPATRAGGYQALPPGEGDGQGGGNDDFLALDMGAGKQDGFMQLQLMENQDVSMCAGRKISRLLRS